VIDDVQIAWGTEVVRVAGREDATVPWKEVVDVLDRS